MLIYLDKMTAKFAEERYPGKLNLKKNPHPNATESCTEFYVELSLRELLTVLNTTCLVLGVMNEEPYLGNPDWLV